MKTNHYVKLAGFAMLVLLSACESKNKKEVKPKSNNVTFHVLSSDKGLELTSLTVTGSKGQDSSITKDLKKFPRSVSVLRKEVKKGEVLAIKAKLNKPGKVSLQIMQNNKLLKEAKNINIKDIKTEAVLSHKL